jgi:Na+/proline symporter
MKQHTLLKGASAAAIVAAVLFLGSAVASYLENTALAWFPIVMALAWFLIAGLFYQRARTVEQHHE